MHQLARSGRRLLIVWAATTVTALLILAIGLSVQGREFFFAFQGPPDASLVEIKFLVFAISWCWLGAILVLAQRTELLRQHGAFLVVLLLVGFAYLSVVRGPHKVEHKDFSNYFNAATHMREGVPLTDDPFQLYLYPPLLATLLEPLVPLGLGPASWLFRMGNYGALLVFTVLLYATLLRFGAARGLAAALVFAAMASNVAVLDTLASQQINLHAANFVLAGLLLFPRHVALSAAAVALGGHLKVYPVLLVLPFVFLRQWRWCGWFALSAIVVTVATSLANSPSYYLEFLRLSSGLQEPGIRNASVASLLHNTARLAGLELGGSERPVALLLQLALATFVAWRTIPVIRSGALARVGSAPERVILSGFAALSLVMLVVSPSIWPHHLVFAILPALVTLLAVQRGSDLALFGAAYFTLFFMPVHEVYPFSYLRLGGLIALSLVMSRLKPSEPTEPPPLVERLTSSSC